MKNAKKSPVKLGVDAMAQTKGGVKVRSSVKAGVKTISWITG